MSKKYFTPSGAQKLRERRATLADQLRDIQSQKNDAAEDGGNAWHDNFSFEELSRQESMVNQQIGEVSALEADMQIVNFVPRSTESLQIGHIAVLDFGGEERVYRVGGYDESDLDTSPPTVAYNAPLLIFFFRQEEGHQATVQIGGRRFQVTLDEIRLMEVGDESGP